MFLSGSQPPDQEKGLTPILGADVSLEDFSGRRALERRETEKSLGIPGEEEPHPPIAEGAHPVVEDERMTRMSLRFMTQ